MMAHDAPPRAAPTRTFTLPRDPLDPRTTASGRSLGRRAFIGRSGAALLALTLSPRLHAQGTVDRARSFPAVGGAPGGAVTTAGAVAFPLDEVTVAELASAMDEGRWSSRALVERYLARIAQLDEGPDGLHAVLEVNPDALAIADALDAERRTSGARGPLHGIPVLLKDNIGTADRMHTSAGSLALADSFAPRDAHVVQRLRAAGCVMLGKSNMSEWSAARGEDAIGGWSARGGFARNPYALDRSTGGSSSGAAAAVAANFVTVAIGTETMGSLVSPSAICGIVGVKPTVGLVGRSGIIPVSYTQDTAGPMARTVRDAALVLSAIAGRDPDDDATSEADAHRVQDYTTFLDRDGLRGARIGVARNLFGTSRAVAKVMDAALERMRAAGAVVVEDANIETAAAIWPFDAEVLAYELKAALDGYLRSLGPGSPVRSIADVIAFNERNAEGELAWFGQETLLDALQRGSLDDPAYRNALAMVRRLARTEGIDATLRAHRLDAIVAPTDTPAWLIDPLSGDNATMGAYVLPAAAGYPSVTVPVGQVYGLPVGMLFMGPAWSEGPVLRLAYALEQLEPARMPPTFQPTVPVGP